MSETEAPRRGFDRSRLRLGIVIAIICGAIAFLLLQIGDAASYLKPADEAVAERADLDGDFRLMGVVVPGSLREEGADVRFVVEYECVTVPVLHKGSRPDLFREDIPIVLHGRFVEGTEKDFLSDKIVVRHTEEYRTEESEQAEVTDAERCSRP
jgi:cytochrome c-type biogenesis protein CcmE